MIEVLIGVVGCLATAMVIVGMILITPAGTERAPARPAPDGADGVAGSVGVDEGVATRVG